MTCYIVTFQTNSEASNDKVQEFLKSYRYYCPIHDHCWAINTEQRAVEIRDKIQNVLDQGERVFVVRSGTEAAWFNSFGEAYDKWLRENL